jgi:hypothetical protein
MWSNATSSFAGLIGTVGGWTSVGIDQGDSLSQRPPRTGFPSPGFMTPWCLQLSPGLWKLSRQNLNIEINIL